MDVSKNHRDTGSHFFEVKGRYKDSFVKLLLFADLLGGCYLFEILHTSSAMKISKNVVKTECF